MKALTRIKAGRGTLAILSGIVKDPVLTGYLDEMHARPAYKRAIEKGGSYELGGNRRPQN